MIFIIPPPSTGNGYLGQTLAHVCGLHVVGIEAHAARNLRASGRAQRIAELMERRANALAAGPGCGGPPSCNRKGRKRTQEAEEKMHQQKKEHDCFHGVIHDGDEFSAPLAAGGAVRSVTMHLTGECAFALGESMRGAVLCGLHTCGDLGPILLRTFLASEARAVVSVGCCYASLTDSGSECGFPLSHYLRARRNLPGLVERSEDQGIEQVGVEMSWGEGERELDQWKNEVTKAADCTYHPSKIAPIFPPLGVLARELATHAAEMWAQKPPTALRIHAYRALLEVALTRACPNHDVRDAKVGRLKHHKAKSDSQISSSSTATSHRDASLVDEPSPPMFTNDTTTHSAVSQVLRGDVLDRTQTRTQGAAAGTTEEEALSCRRGAAADELIGSRMVACDRLETEEFIKYARSCLDKIFQSRPQSALSNPLVSSHVSFDLYGDHEHRNLMAAEGSGCNPSFSDSTLEQLFSARPYSSPAIAFLYALRLLVGRVIETVILLDRAVMLSEQLGPKATVGLRMLFDPIISPRNCVIYAMKNE